MKLRKSKYGYYFLDTYVDGKRVRMSLDTKDRKLASTKAKIKEIELQNTIYSSGKPLKQFIEEYLIWSKPRRELTTWKNYESVLKVFSEQIKTERIEDVTREQAEKFILYLSQPRTIKDKTVTMSGRGVNYYLRTLRAIFNDAVEMGIISSNPFLKIEKMRENTIKPRVLTKDELKTFFDIVKEKYPQYFDLFVFYLLTGVRRREALTLKWVDVHFDSDSMIIHGKRDKYRIVPMLPMVKSLLWARKNKDIPFACSGSTITHIFSKVCDKAKIKGVKLHDLRKTFSTMLADRGISDMFIKEWLGHEDEKVTRTHYIGYNDETTRKKVKILEDELIEKNLPELARLSAQKGDGG